MPALKRLDRRRKSHGAECCRLYSISIHAKVAWFKNSSVSSTSIEHVQEPPLERPPQKTLAILVRAVGQRLLVDDAQPQQAFAYFLGHHRRTVVGEQGAGQAPLLDCLGEPMHEVLGGFPKIPLEVATQARVIVEDGQNDGAHATGRPAVGTFFETVVEIEVPRSMPTYWAS